MIFNSVVITEDSLNAARQFFIDNAHAQINAVRCGEMKVNDVDKFIDCKIEAMLDYESGRYDHTFTMMQRAHYIQTGESVALLT